MTINRREFIKLGLTASSLLALGQGSDILTKTLGKTGTPKKVIILGLDGMDPHLLSIWMKEGKLPHFQQLWREGDFRPLRTSIPPQSPVAWSNFITGTNPGGHAIFDFIHRDPENYIPIFSAVVTPSLISSIEIQRIIFPFSLHLKLKKLKKHSLSVI